MLQFQMALWSCKQVEANPSHFQLSERISSTNPFHQQLLFLSSYRISLEYMVFKMDKSHFVYGFCRSQFLQGLVCFPGQPLVLN